MMDGIECLMIGGPRDGERIMVCCHVIAVSVLPSVYEEFTGEKWTKDVSPIFRYHYHPLPGGVGLAVFEHTTIDEAMRLLASRYQGRPWTHPRDRKLPQSLADLNA